MKILYVVPYPPSVIRVRPFQMIRHLRARGHDVTVGTVWGDARDRPDLEALAREGSLVARHLPRWRSLWNMLRALPTPTPLQAAYAWEPGLAQELRTRVRSTNFDVIHVEHLRGARYGQCLRRELAPLPRRPPVIWDSVDCISHLFAQATRHTRSPWWQLLTRFELPRTRRMEGALGRQFDRVLVTSEKDRVALDELIRLSDVPPLADSPIRVVPNGVDIDHFTPGDEPGPSPAIILSGKMSYHANLTAARYLVDDIMPAVWARCPGAHVSLVGQAPPRSLRQLAEQYPGRVTVTGAVDDLRPYLRETQVAVAPIPYGAGIQNKVLEAMACAAPVVASPQAVAALQAVPGRDVLVAEGGESFARAILSLLEDPARARELGWAGRRYVERHHRWSDVAGALEAIYREAVEQTFLDRPGMTEAS